jgi:hypothetical protein
MKQKLVAAGLFAGLGLLTLAWLVFLVYEGWTMLGAIL